MIADPAVGVLRGFDCVIPAAGESVRMGRPKQLVDWEGRPLIEVTVRNALTACRRCIVVTGAASDRVSGALAGIPGVTIVHNPDYREGMLSSIIAGLGAVSTGWCFIVPGDMPALGAALFHGLAAAAEGRDQIAAIFPRLGDRRGHPVLLRSSLRERLLESGGRFSRMRDFLEQWPCLDVPVTDPSIFHDVDRPEDLPGKRGNGTR